MSNRSMITLFILALLISLYRQFPIAANTNGNGLMVKGVTTSNVGIKTTRQKSGVHITAAISPYGSRTTASPQGARVFVGPASIVQRVAVSSRARYWAKYE